LSAWDRPRNVSFGVADNAGDQRAKMARVIMVSRQNSERHFRFGASHRYPQYSAVLGRITVRDPHSYRLREVDH
jgi:hypothetical protein